MGKRIDLTGQRFGRLVVGEYSHTDKNAKRVYECKCDCGNNCYKTSGCLVKGSNSCNNCTTVICKTSSDGKYLEAYFVNDFNNINKEFEEFDMSIFNTDSIVIEKNIGMDKNFKINPFKSRPDFIFDTTYLQEIESNNWRRRDDGTIVMEINKKKTSLQRFLINLVDESLVSERWVTFKTNKNYDFRVDNLIFSKPLLVRQRSKRINNQTKYKGVRKQKTSKYFQVRIRINGKETHLGTYHTQEEAALAYNKKAIEVYGKFADLNNIPKNVKTCERVKHNKCSDYKGVSPFKGKWKVSLWHNNKNVYGGTYNTQEEAAEAYNTKAKELFGKFAYQNEIKKPKKQKQLNNVN